MDEELSEDSKAINREFARENPGWTSTGKYCVTEFDTAPIRSTGQLRVKVRPIPFLSYFPIAKSLARAITPKAEPQDIRLREKEFSTIKSAARPLIPNMLIIQMIVTVYDQGIEKLLFTQRKDKKRKVLSMFTVAYLSGTWSVSLEEHFLAPKRLFPDLPNQKGWNGDKDETVFDGLRRALKDELHIDEFIEGTTIRVLGAGFEYQNFNTAIYAIAELPRELTYEKLVEHIGPSPEFQNIALCTFDIPTLTSIFETGEPPDEIKDEMKRTGKKKMLKKWAWHPTSRMRVALAVRRRFGEDAFRELLEKGKKQDLPFQGD